jgi:hypothetical protein
MVEFLVLFIDRNCNQNEYSSIQFSLLITTIEYSSIQFRERERERVEEREENVIIVFLFGGIFLNK